MKKLMFAVVLSAFAVTSFNAYACDGMKDHKKAGDNTQANGNQKKDGAKKSDEAAKTDQKS